MVTVQVLGHLKMIDPAQIQSKPLHLCGECPSHHLGREVDQEILSQTLNITLGLWPRVILRILRLGPHGLVCLKAQPWGWIQVSLNGFSCPSLPLAVYTDNED